MLPASPPSDSLLFHFSIFFLISFVWLFHFQKIAELSQHDPSLPFVRLNVGGSLFTPLRDTLKASTFFEDLLAEVERGRIKLPTDPRYAALHQGVPKRPRRNTKYDFLPRELTISSSTRRVCGIWF